MGQLRTFSAARPLSPDCLPLRLTSERSRYLGNICRAGGAAADQASSIEKRAGDRALSSDQRIGAEIAHDQNGWSQACRNDVQRIDIRVIELIRGCRTEKLHRRQELPEGIAGLVRGCIPQFEIADQRIDRIRLNVDQAGNPQYFKVLLHGIPRLIEVSVEIS
jgi:hypothetical protein